MTSGTIDKIIAKYLTKEASLLERNELEAWLENPRNFEYFKTYVKINYLINLNMDLFDSHDSKKQLLELIDKDKKVHRLRNYTKLLKYAAILIILVGLGYLYKSDIFFSNPTINIPPDSITLELENGDIKILDQNGTTIVLDEGGNVVGEQKGQELSYVQSANIDELVYNTLTVPYGKRFDIKLSDGTRVFLNSGTSLKYPIQFINSGPRQVFLTGEAYFDVTSDTSHPFIVNSEILNVEVLGTEFNVSAYPEDSISDVVLVEGSVGLYENGKGLIDGLVIPPGTKGSISKKTKQINAETVNTSIYTSWLQGGLVFRDMPFKNIVKKLERHYNMKIVVLDENLKEEVFNASFKDEPIEKVLNYFSASYDINYSIKDNAITIN
ncbi:FecR family protein [Flagellimonas sp.]|uniref:FecR family protein n=1 Tax=Flagellimonas sp. TaxID=2058762 RepID=UPI003BAE5BC4